MNSHFISKKILNRKERGFVVKELVVNTENWMQKQILKLYRSMGIEYDQYYINIFQIGENSGSNKMWRYV